MGHGPWANFVDDSASKKIDGDGIHSTHYSRPSNE